MTHTFRVVLGVLLLTCGAAAFAQAYPAKPVRVIVPYTPGGGADFVTRIFTKGLSDQLGQQFFVDNRGGANGNIGAEIAAKSQPNGYTLLSAANTTVTINPSLYKQMPIDMLKDLVPVSILASQPNVLIAHPSLPAKSVKELVAIARSRPRQLDYASSGTGSSSHIAAELFRSIAKVDIVHVPYKGNGPAMADLISGHVQLMFNNLAPSVPQVKAGKLRAYAVTSEKRSPVAPELPTMAEAGYPGVVFNLWIGMLAPAGTPADIVSKLNAETAKAGQVREVRDHLLAQGAEPVAMSPSQMADVVRKETAQWAQVVKAAKITPQ
ncbi:MAG TPA: tripartite tricarboxylate transporter substrate binding protein [Burkholderiales bacterium]|nr:tripartite tricarboxylate transporter substrate binding protein [Burkholderiales bacterium]